MKNIHVMKSPDDLDLGSDKQAKVVTVLSKHGVGIVDLMKQVDTLQYQLLGITTDASVAMWQRWVYELDKKAKETGDPIDKLKVESAWLTVKFIQDSLSQAIDITMKPEMEKFMDKHGKGDELRKAKEYAVANDIV